MNLLAHAYLSDRNPDLLIGNFIGDFIKGDPENPRHGLTPGEVAGVRVHRAIDTFTDEHADVQAVRELLYPRCHKYAGVAVDVFFDHFLAANFAELTGGEALNEFVQDVYAALEHYRDRIPESATRMIAYMIRQDWLTSYQHRDGIDRALKGLAHRTAFPSGLDTAIEDFDRYYDEIKAHFDNFWPSLDYYIQLMRTLLAPEP